LPGLTVRRDGSPTSAGSFSYRSPARPQRNPKTGVSVEHPGGVSTEAAWRLDGPVVLLGGHVADQVLPAAEDRPDVPADLPGTEAPSLVELMRMSAPGRGTRVGHPGR
jgi:hypothetical protein